MTQEETNHLEEKFKQLSIKLDIALQLLKSSQELLTTMQNKDEENN